MSSSQTAGQTGVDSHDSARIASGAADLEESGVSFVAQYIGTDPATEDGGGAITTAQVQAVLGAGLQIVSIFETNGMSSTVFKTGAKTFGWETYLTTAQGKADATAAAEAAQALGQPPGTAIYFAMDFDPAATDGTIDTATALSRVNSYFRGINDHLASLPSDATYTVGVYGAGATLRSVFEAGLAQYTWLGRSTAWDGYSIGETDGPTRGWSMIQSPRSPFEGIPVNNDLTATADFGAWGADTQGPCC
jgi:Domain of unknown function (DUF1906)